MNGVFRVYPLALWHANGSSVAFFPHLFLLSSSLFPAVMGYAFAFGFFKLINYAMFFQLPIILSSNFSPSSANLISSLYSFGMMPGKVLR